MWAPIGQLFETYDALICPTWAVTGIPAGDSILGHDLRGRRAERPAVHVLHVDAVQHPGAVPGARRAERDRGVERRADRDPDRRADLRRRDRVPDRRRSRAGRPWTGLAPSPHERRGTGSRRWSTPTWRRGLRCPGRLLHVLAPGLGVDLEVAAGVEELGRDRPLQPGSRFRIASVTKPFVAAAALRLVEQGRLPWTTPPRSCSRASTTSSCGEGATTPKRSPSAICSPTRAGSTTSRRTPTATS